MTLEEFSNGYYKAEMDIQPYSGGPVIEAGLYDFINRRVYAQTDSPITMRVGLEKGPYFSVKAESAVPTDVLALPQEWINDMDISVNKQENSIFVLKPDHSYFINQAIDLSDSTW